MARSRCPSIPDNYCFYLATPPDLFANVTQKIVRNGLGKEENGLWRRFIYEKPFGHDLESAKKLNAALLKLIKERQIYRIDHYLGKETVQNIMVFRFGNGIFEPIEPQFCRSLPYHRCRKLGSNSVALLRFCRCSQTWSRITSQLVTLTPSSRRYVQGYSY